MATDPTGGTTLSPSQPKFLGIPMNRILTFAGPYISLGSGAVASWLLVHVHLLGLFHFQRDGLATGITQGVVLLLTAALSWLGQRAWIKGHHIELEAAGKLLLSQYEHGDLRAPATQSGAVPGETEIDEDSEDAAHPPELAESRRTPDTPEGSA